VSFKSRAYAALTAAVVIAGFAGAAKAQSLPTYYLDLTETRAGLQVQTNLPTFPGYTDNAFVPDSGPGPEFTWPFGSPTGGYDEFVPVGTAPGSVEYKALAWGEPGTPTYNLLFIQPNDAQANVSFFAIGDVSTPQFGYVNFIGACFVPGGASVACPMLPDDQAFVTPISNQGTPLGTLSVKFDDDSAAPEPSAWALMIAGVFLLGAALRGRLAAGLRAI
jgi:hypothetical protein